MKHQHSSHVATTSVHATPKARATPARLHKASSPRTAESSESAESRDRAIRETAYALYEARDRVDGHELDDWFQAEAEVDRVAVAEPVESIAEGQPEPSMP